MHSGRFKKRAENDETLTSSSSLRLAKIPSPSRDNQNLGMNSRVARPKANSTLQEHLVPLEHGPTDAKQTVSFQQVLQLVHHESSHLILFEHFILHQCLHGIDLSSVSLLAKPNLSCDDATSDTFSPE